LAEDPHFRHQCATHEHVLLVEATLEYLLRLNPTQQLA